MRTTRRLTIALCILAASNAVADEQGSKENAESTKPAREGVLPSFETAEQIKTMKACEATVEETHGCYAVCKAADGTKFTLGFPGNTKEIQAFLNTLKQGQTYRFPSAFLSYQKKSRR